MPSGTDFPTMVELPGRNRIPLRQVCDPSYQKSFSNLILPMKPFCHALLILVGLCFCQVCLSQEDLSKLEASAEAFVKAFNEGDSEAISELFLPNGELILASGELIAGQEEIRSHYEEVFADTTGPKAALEAGSVRFLTDSLAVEDGTIHLNYPDGEISSHFYTAVHAKQDDGTWRFASVRDEVGDHALPSEKLMELSWLIGDWLIQTDFGGTWLTFSWSEDGPYIDARAVSESPEGPSTAATMRIGWNEKEEAFISWGFDAEGGFNQSSWTERSEGEWILRTEGVTSTGESNHATQVLAMEKGGDEFVWIKRDQTIGGEAQPDRTLSVVRRPPEPLADTKSAE